MVFSLITNYAFLAAQLIVSFFILFYNIFRHPALFQDFVLTQ